MNEHADDLVAVRMGLVGGDGAVSVRVEDCAPLVGAVQVEMGEATAAVRTGGSEVPARRGG